MQEKRYPTTSRRPSVQRRLYFPEVDIHLGVAALLAIILQLSAIFGPFGSEDLPRRLLFIASYILLLGFVGANVRRPGIIILGIGILCNFLVIVANGGLMPTTAEAYGENGEIAADVRPGDWIPHSKDVLLDRSDVNLYFLSDHFTNGGDVIRVFSIGDVMIAAGLILTMAEVALPRLGRKPE